MSVGSSVQVAESVLGKHILSPSIIDIDMHRLIIVNCAGLHCLLLPLIYLNLVFN